MNDYLPQSHPALAWLALCLLLRRQGYTECAPPMHVLNVKEDVIQHSDLRGTVAGHGNEAEEQRTSPSEPADPLVQGETAVISCVSDPPVRFIWVSQPLTIREAGVNLLGRFRSFGGTHPCTDGLPVRSHEGTTEMATTPAINTHASNAPSEDTCQESRQDRFDCKRFHGTHYGPVVLVVWRSRIVK